MSEPAEIIETTPEVPTEAAPPATPPPPKEQPDLSTRLAKAEASAQRRREQAQNERKAREELEQKYQSTSKEYELTRSEVEKIKALRERAAEGDDDAIAELLGFDFDTLTRLKLDPDSTRRSLKDKRVMTEAERRVEALEAKLKEREEREHAAQLEYEKRTLVAVARDLKEDPDLQALDDDAIVAIGSQLAPEMAQRMGRVPTFPEIAKAVAEQMRPYHQRIFEAYSKRAAPAPSPVAPKKPADPKVIPNAAATQNAAEQRPMTAEERREAAIKKAKELINH